MIRPALLLALLALTLALLPAPSSVSASEAFQPCAVTQVSATGPEQPGDIVTTFGIGLDPATCAPFASATERPGEYNFDRLIFFTPPEWHVAEDADIADGVKVGSLKTKISLGLFNNPCNTLVNFSFDLSDGTASQDEIVYPFNGPDPLRTMRDNNSDGLLDGAQRWPSYLSAVADQAAFNLSDLIARYIGVNTTAIPGTTTVVNVLVFRPGATLFGAEMDARLGYPSIVVLNDPSRPATPESITTDFCAPFWIETTLQAEVLGLDFRVSPPDGTYGFTTFVVPLPDQDADGIENQLDPCATTPNASDWDPRGSQMQDPGDMDGDGLPDDCDPNPSEPSPCTAALNISLSDDDCDGWANRGDNCPLVDNLEQEDGEGDGIGDACDPDPVGVAATPSVCVVNYVTTGAGGPPPTDPQTLIPCSSDPVTGDLTCDHVVNVADIRALLLDWAEIEDTPCGGGYPWTCDGFPANILLLMRQVVEPHPWFIGCA